MNDMSKCIDHQMLANTFILKLKYNKNTSVIFPIVNWSWTQQFWLVPRSVSIWVRPLLTKEQNSLIAKNLQKMKHVKWNLPINANVVFLFSGNLCQLKIQENWIIIIQHSMLAMDHGFTWHSSTKALQTSKEPGFTTVDVLKEEPHTKDLLQVWSIQLVYSRLGSNLKIQI